MELEETASIYCRVTADRANRCCEELTFIPRLTSGDKLLWNEATDKNSGIPPPSMKRVLKKSQDPSLLSGNTTLWWKEDAKKEQETGMYTGEPRGLGLGAEIKKPPTGSFSSSFLLLGKSGKAPHFLTVETRCFICRN